MLHRKLAVLGFAGSIALFTALPRAHGADTTLTPLADAYVRDGSYASTNYGSSTALYVKTDTTGFNRDSYLKFDLSSVSSIGSATLRLYGLLNSSGSVTT